MSYMSEPSYRLIAPQANRSFVFKWEPFRSYSQVALHYLKLNSSIL